MKNYFKLALLGLLALSLFTACDKPEKESDDGNGGGNGTGGAEVTMASIKGGVSDAETGKPLSLVEVELLPTGRKVFTTTEGWYAFNNLDEGTYVLQAEAEGYETYKSEAVNVTDTRVFWNIVMTPLNTGVEEPEEPQEPELKADFTETAFGVDFEMVYVQGGTFQMGATAEQGDDANDNEYPVRTVKLNSYHIGKYVVTKAQWKAVMGTEPLGFYGGNLPVASVSWEDAQEFCEKLSAKTGKKYVLPTEAQWEYAARGGKKSKGYKYAGSNNIDEVAWYKSNSEFNTHAVGTKKANELGIYDMSGNVDEMCADWYADYDESDTDNPTGPQNGDRRVYRGGGWYGVARDCRVSFRSSCRPGYGFDDLSFRVALLP
ncbi:MAG: SUMF1/EgtB/PvdO family nonheme iron enzyme [Bacteroides sp.]|nr:SUMF1/EgtB/PvdO family nonheme iron enzyme [Bacteroides sp.]MCM1085290.1 SUMF1/EgtB/PvdO family nonheme iron enzyme [Bacteroides sp.]